jgi:TolB-like protein
VRESWCVNCYLANFRDALQGQSQAIREIAQELNVDAVVEGSVLRVEGRVRISAQLIHASTDEHVSAESYDRDFCNALSLGGR